MVFFLNKPKVGSLTPGLGGRMLIDSPMVGKKKKKRKKETGKKKNKKKKKNKDWSTTSEKMGTMKNKEKKKIRSPILMGPSRNQQAHPVGRPNHEKFQPTSAEI